MKRIVILSVLCLLMGNVAWAQVTMNELIDAYVAAKNSNESMTPYETRVSQIYQSLDDGQKVTFRQEIYNRISASANVTGISPVEEDERLALADLYVLVSGGKDEQLTDIYFQKGEIYALQTGDTLKLKECIAYLKLSDQSKTEKVVGYINTLTDYLEQIRNVLPVSQRIDGVWVSNAVRNIGWTNKIIYFTPSFVLNIHQGDVKLENIGAALCLADYSYINEKVKSDEQTYAQSVVDIGKDKLYMAWSSEKIKIPNQAVALSLGQTAGDVTSSVVREGTSDLLGNIGGDLVGGIAGNVIGGIITGLFAPSKKIYVLEMELEKKNDYELQGHYCFQTIKIDGNGKPEVSKEEKEVTFVKYDVESCVYFGSSGNMYKYIPGYGVQKEFPAQYQERFESLAEKYQKALYAHKNINWTYSDFQLYFSRLQIRKLIYFAEQKLLQQGCRQEDLCFGDRKTAVSGVLLENRTGKEVKLPKNMKGVYVYDVIHKTDSGQASAFLFGDNPAFLFGVKQGDIILSVDGYEVDSPSQFSQYIQSLNPYDWVTLHIKRGGKERDIEVELTWY